MKADTPPAPLGRTPAGATTTLSGVLVYPTTTATTTATRPPRLRLIGD